MKDGINIAFRDFLFIIVLVFIAFVLLLLPHINDPKKQEQQDKETNIPGNMSIEMRWGDGVDADVDLWVVAPDDAPVGYSNLGANIFNLLRDDRGYQMNKGSIPGSYVIPNNIDTNLMVLNFENAYSRGIPKGEYIINVHLWNQRTAKMPIEVSVAITIKKPNGNPEQILTRTVLMRGTGHEMTIVRFRLDIEGNLIESSLNADFKKLAPSRVSAS